MRFHPARTTAAALLGLGLALGGCTADSDPSTSDGDSSASSADHNDADVAFASQMIPHHAQALVMVDLTRGRPLDRDFASLTEQIRAAQTPEIETMSDWLTEWDEEVPATMRDHVHGDMDMDDMGDMGDMGGEMPGMMSAEDMAALATAPDRAFERLWLTMMIEHHAGAVTMAEDELARGEYEPALELAQAIIDGQTEEIATMREMLAG